MARIMDRYTDWPVSSTIRYEYRHMDRGLCTRCNRPAVTSRYCEYHRQKANSYVRRWYATHGRVKVYVRSARVHRIAPV